MKEHNVITVDVNRRRLTGLAKARQARRQKFQTPVLTTEIPAQNRLSRLEPTRRRPVEDRLSQMPKTCMRTYLKAASGRSPSAGIKAFCLECVSWQRAEVAHCTAQACPLWPYRPFRKEETP